MRIVLTNDDGVAALGLEALRQACAGLDAQIAIVAPARPQSGVGHRVTTTRGMRLTEIETGRHALDGSPVDCARVALKHIEPRADWVFSGINHGGNLGVDFYPSGTIAAAREAALLGFRAVAVSQVIAPGRQVDWSATTRRTAAVLAHLAAVPLPPGAYWNVNLPHPEDDDADCEIVECPLDPAPMDVRFRLEDGHYHYEGDYFGRPRTAGHDVDVCFSGGISITRVSVHDFVQRR